MSSENIFIKDLHQDTDNPYSTHITKNELLVIQQSIKWDNGYWTLEEKKVLHSKMSRCFILKESHWEIARRCAKRYKLINFPKVISSTILASSLTLFTQQEQENKLFIYFNAILSIFVAILTTSSSFIDYNVQKARHRSSSLGYGKLAVYIDRVLRLPPDERETFGDTLLKVNEEYASLRTEAPFLNTGIVSKYTKIYRLPETETRSATQYNQQISTIYPVIQPDNAYHYGLSSGPSDKNGIIDHIRGKTNLIKKFKPNMEQPNMNHTSIENEEYFTEINDSNKTKAKSLAKILRPLIGPEVEPELIKAISRRRLPSPILRASPKLIATGVSRTNSNNSIDSLSVTTSPTMVSCGSSPISIPTPQDSF